MGAKHSHVGQDVTDTESESSDLELDSSLRIALPLPAERHGPFTGGRSFIDVLGVPQLAESCIKALHGDYGVSGLKILRSVSKGARDVVHRMIKIYTMVLGAGCPPHHSDMLMKFVQTVNLVELKIRIPKSPPAGPAGESKF